MKLIRWNITRFTTCILSVIMLVLQVGDICIFAQDAETDVQIYKWDFEDNKSNVWYASDGEYSVEYRNGMAVVETGRGGDNSYITHPAAELDTYKYLVIKARNKGTANAFKFEYTTSAGTATVEIPVNEKQTAFSEYSVDMSKQSFWVGLYAEGKLFLGNGGTVEIEEIYFASEYTANERLEYHFNMAGCFTWDSKDTTNISYSDGVLTVDTTGGTMYTPELADGAYSFEDYRYLVFKANTDDVSSSGNFDAFARGTEWFKEIERMATRLKYVEDGNTYLYFDMNSVKDRVEAAGWRQGGCVKQIMLQLEAGAFKFTDIYLSNKAPAAYVEKFGIYPSSYEINSNKGETTITPYLRLSDGSELYDYSSMMWAVDSISASPVINGDRTLTLTGQINGEIGVIGYFTYGNTEYSAECNVRITGQPNRIAAKKIKLMTYGNSIHRHPPNESLNWTYDWGMAASSRDKDYVHRLIYYLEEKYGKGNVEWVMGSGAGNFESDSSNAKEGQDWTAYLQGLTACAEREQPDIVTVQLGENSHPGETGYSGTAAGYRDAMTQFVQMLQKGAPHAVILITTPFWGGTAKVDGANAAAKNLNIPIANLAQFNTRANKAYEEQGGRPEWTNGVKEHPGDLGMEHIAQEMYKQINKYLTGKDNVEYSVPQTGIEITSKETEITTDCGTLRLTAKILPVEASQEVVWSSENNEIATVAANGVVTARRNGTVKITATSKYNSLLSADITLTISGQSRLFTLTYSANTNDAVADMPAIEEAKGKISLAGKYPFRETYSFVGWSLTPDGNVIDNVTVSDDITLYAIWQKASAWTFDRDNYKEGFTIDNGFNQYVTDGRFKAIETEYSIYNILKVHSPVLNLEADEYSALELSLQNTAYKADTVLNVTVHTTDGDFDFEYPVVTSEPVTYTVKLDNVTGTITGFDFTPTNMDCTIYIDDIRFKETDPNDDSFYLKKATPKTGTNGVSTDDDIVLQYNREIDISDIKADINGIPIKNISVVNSGKAVSLRPDILDYLTAYKVTVSGIKSKTGKQAEPVEIEFVTAQQQNILFSNDFNTGITNNLENESITATISTADGTYYSAPSGLKLSAPTQGYSRLTPKCRPLEVGKVYRISFRYKKPANSTTTDLNVITSDEGSYIAQLSPGTEWKYCQATFTAKYKDTSKNIEGATIKAPLIRLLRSPDATGAVYIDDFELVEVPEAVRVPNIDGDKPILVNQPVDIEFTVPISSVKNVILEMVDGTQITAEPKITVKDNKVSMDFGDKLKYNTYYRLSALVTDKYGRENTLETDFITEEQVSYTTAKIYRNGLEIGNTSSISAGDKLTATLFDLHNKSMTDDITLNAIIGVYNGTTMVTAQLLNFKLTGDETSDKELPEIIVPYSLGSDSEIKVFVWSDITDEHIKAEIGDYYSLK